MSSNGRPLVSIGLPVYNGERYIREALDSLLRQTLRDMELVISDNASTDATEDICLKYARQDGRIRYSRNDHNIGAGRNHNRVFELSRGKYFIWAAYDDVYAPELLAECVRVLEEDPSVVLCHTQIIVIDEAGKPVRKMSLDKGRSQKAHIRFRGLTRLDHTCDQQYGMVRSEVMGSTPLVRLYTDSDRTLLAELSLYGRFYEIPKPLFFRRVHQATSTRVYPDWRARMVLSDPSLAGRLVFPHWLQFADYMKSIGRTPMNLWPKLRCYGEMGPWLVIYGKGLVKDLLVAGDTLVKRPFKKQNAGVAVAVKGT